ncbi:MAG TPA: Flp pilus assembly protein CpaB [Bryobacteraceae bacterium]|nr:Flp pilus assembly protein CpaB [Bryobacteraceae bacterium]
MNKRLLSVLAFALAVSGVATFLVARVIQGRFTAAKPQPEATVLVAAHDLGIGALIKEGDVKMAPWSGPLLPQAITKREDLLDRGVVANIYAGEPIIETRLSQKGTGAGLAAMIPKGKRAVALRVNEVVGVAGFVVPGMRVDVLVSGTPPNQPQNLGTETKTILQNIEVLSAGQSIQKDAENKPVSVQVVNVLVTPEQAESLSLASNDARVQLVLRNPLDNDEAKTSGVYMANLFNKTSFSPTPQPVRVGPRRTGPPRSTVVTEAFPPPPRVAAPTSIIVEVLHSGKKEKATFTKQAEVSQ